MSVAAYVGLATELMRLFGRGRRAERILRVMEQTEGRIDAFRSARDRIDTAARDDGAEVTLTSEQVIALDAYLDLTAKTGRQIKKLLK